MKHFCALKDRTYVEMLGRVRLVGVAIAVLLCAGYSASAWGQFDSASVLGTIKDPSGSSVAAASVELRSISKGVTVTRQTDANGNYEFDNVQPGEFAISATAPGFQKTSTNSFVVNIGARQRVELALKLGTDTQTVTVSGAAALLETDSSDRGETIQSREIVNLPLASHSSKFCPTRVVMLHTT
jgi:hypothetical protein